MIRSLRTKDNPISARRDRGDLETLFGEEAIKAVLRFIDHTEVGRPLVKEENKDDYWDIERMDQRLGEEDVMMGDGGE